MNQVPLKPVLSALFTALIIIGAYLAVPFPGGLPPLVLTIFFLFLGGLILGPVWGTASALVYLALGALGLGVFAQGKGGFGIILGPTGGFLLGYVAAILVTGLLSDRKKYNPLRNLGAVLAGMAVLYALGLPWLQAALPNTYKDLWAASVAMAPFMVSDVIKGVLAVILTSTLKPLLLNYFPPKDSQGKK